MLLPTALLLLGCQDSAHTLGNARDGGGGSGGTNGGTGGVPGTGGTDGGQAATGGVTGTGGGAAGGNGSGGTGGSGGRGGSGGANGTGGLSGTGGTGGGSGGPGGAGGTGGAGGAMSCSSLPVVACPSGLVCDNDTPNRCGAGFEPGHCIVLPIGCTTIFDPVCGCDGRTYSNDCERQSARAQLDHAGACGGQGGAGGGVGASGLAGCAACNSATQYCRVTSGGAVGNPPSYMCLALPAACGATPTCTCLVGVDCAPCMSPATGPLTVSCFVP